MRFYSEFQAVLKVSVVNEMKVLKVPRVPGSFRHSEFLLRVSGSQYTTTDLLRADGLELDNRHRMSSRNATCLAECVGTALRAIDEFKFGV